MKPELRIELEVQGEKSWEDLSALLARLEEFARAWQVPPAVLRDLSLAVDEIVSNVIRHGCEAGRSHQVLLEARLEPDVLIVELEDDGRAFNLFDAPRAATDLGLEERAPGGVGLFLVRELMDAVDYEWSGGKNRHRLVRALRRAPQLPGELPAEDSTQPVPLPPGVRRGKRKRDRR